MSIDIMNRIWWRDFSSLLEPIQSNHPGSEKNFAWTLLALADAAGDEGFCWPSVKTIARKARLSPRAVQIALKQAEVVGILRRRPRRDSSTQYLFNLSALPHVDRPSGWKEKGPVEYFDEPEPDLFGTGAGDSPVGDSPVQGVRGTGAGDSLPRAGDAPITINESSLEPSESGSGDDKPKIASAGYVEKRFSEAWQMLSEEFDKIPAVRMWSDARRTALLARYKDWSGETGLTFDAVNSLTQSIYDKIRASSFLTGRTKDWAVTVDWVLKLANFNKIMEGNYDDGQRTTADRAGGRSNIAAGANAIQRLADRGRKPVSSGSVPYA